MDKHQKLDYKNYLFVKVHKITDLYCYIAVIWMFIRPRGQQKNKVGSYRDIHPVIGFVVNACWRLVLSCKPIHLFLLVSILLPTCDFFCKVVLHEINVLFDYF